MSIKVMSMVFDADNLTPAQKLVMLSLADHGAEDGTRIYPSVETTTEKTGLSERQVRRTLADLRKMGLIFIIRAAGQHRATEYAIDIKTLKSIEPRPARVAPLEKSRPARVASLEKSRPATVSARPARVAPNPLETSKDKSETLSGAKPARARDPLFDAICLVCGIDPTIKGNGASVGKVRAALLSAQPPYTPAEVLAWGELQNWRHTPPTIWQLQQGIGAIRNGNGTRVKEANGHGMMAEALAELGMTDGDD